MATDPGAPQPDIDRPDVSPDEAPATPTEPMQPGTPQAPDEVPLEAPPIDQPDQGPDEIPPMIAD